MTPRPRRLPRAVAAALGSALVLTVAACATGATTSGSAGPGTAAGSGSARGPSAAAVGRAGPAGAFTTVAGSTVDVASYRGKPTPR